ncbi:sugar porter family MFS transporter [Ottowia thiooxydans]|uniref:sugar porter family MFS transporter n=1 Tax=Ottowia thiooxydans TaxID=219182 RepID=UPI00048B38CE|nr:sugar porter family MFS transporter [Ottowia thiooxydans]
MALPSSVLRVACMVCSAGTIFGFGIAAIAGVLPALERSFDLGLASEQRLVFSLVIACFFGALAAGPLSLRWGRRPVLWLAALVSAAANAWMLTSPSYGALVAARVLAGFSIGLLSMVAPMYAAEACTARYRGGVVCLFQLAITGGILGAYGAALAFEGQGQWHLVLGIGMVPALLLMAALVGLPESPRWLHRQGRVEESAEVVAKLGLQQEWEAAPPASASAPADWIALLRQGRVAAVLALCAGLFVLQNLSGIDGILYYAPHIFRDMGFSGERAALLATFGLGLANFLATLVGVVLVDRLGRRPLLIGGSAAMAVGLAIVVLAAFQGWPLVGLLGLCLYIVAFALSLGPLPYVMMAELFPGALRERGIAFASAVSWLFNALIALTFLSLMDAVGLATAIGLFLGVCVLSLIVSLRWVPETRGVSLEEIEARVLAGERLRRLGR